MRVSKGLKLRVVAQSGAGDQLAQEFGRVFEAKNLRRMVQFAQTFPLPAIVATLSRQLNWIHFVNLLPLKTEPARQPGEEAPIGLILCAESSREQVELQQMHKDGITVAEYWTELPPKAELEQKLHAALLEARERLARRGVLLGDLDDE
jgi:DUF1016 N-terminal domain